MPKKQSRDKAAAQLLKLVKCEQKILRLMEKNKRDRDKYERQIADLKKKNRKLQTEGPLFTVEQQRALQERHAKALSGR